MKDSHLDYRRDLGELLRAIQELPWRDEEPEEAKAAGMLGTAMTDLSQGAGRADSWEERCWLSPKRSSSEATMSRSMTRRQQVSSMKQGRCEISS